MLKIPGHYSPDVAGWIEEARRRVGGNGVHSSH
jgi:hypothetical protein